MQIIIGKTAGFCFGVKNAVTKAEEELEKNDEIYCLGELVHNKQVTGALQEKGMKFIENVGEAKNKMIIRSHGVTKETYEIAREKNLIVIDLTCPKVLHIHNIAEEYVKKGYYIIIIGKKEHPEMIGTLSFCGEEYSVIEHENEVENAIQEYEKSQRDKVLVIAQTTYSLEKFNQITEQIKQKINVQNLEIKNTICNATQERQKETEEIAKNVEAMIIIGGKNSSNSTKLFELAKKYCDNVIFIETEQELELKKIKNVNTLGIMAGASTPQDSIEKIVEKINKIC